MGCRQVRSDRPPQVRIRTVALTTLGQRDAKPSSACGFPGSSRSRSSSVAISRSAGILLRSRPRGGWRPQCGPSDRVQAAERGRTIRGDVTERTESRRRFRIRTQESTATPANGVDVVARRIVLRCDMIARFCRCRCHVVRVRARRAMYFHAPERIDRSGLHAKSMSGANDSA